MAKVVLIVTIQGVGIIKAVTLITWQNKQDPLYNGLPFMHVKGKLLQFPSVAELKFDGEFIYVVKCGGLYAINKPEHGRIRTDFPALEVFNAIPDNSVLCAELVWGAGKDFYEFSRHKKDDGLNIAVHGVIRWGGSDIWRNTIYAQQRQIIESLDIYNDNVCIVPKWVVRNTKELDTVFNQVTSEGFEGLVIKQPQSTYFDGNTYKWAKMKFEADADFVIIGFETGTKRAKTLSVSIAHRAHDGNLKRIASVGTGFKADEKLALLKVLQTKITGKEKDTFTVPPELVITVNYKGAIYNPDGTVNSIRHPVFKKFRYDCTVKDVDTIE